MFVCLFRGKEEEMRRRYMNLLGNVLEILGIHKLKMVYLVSLLYFLGFCRDKMCPVFALY